MGNNEGKREREREVEERGRVESLANRSAETEDAPTKLIRQGQDDAKSIVELHALAS